MDLRRRAKAVVLVRVAIKVNKKAADRLLALGIFLQLQVEEDEDALAVVVAHVVERAIAAFDAGASLGVDERSTSRTPRG